MNLSLMILAAGIGSRYGGLKQIDPVGPSGEKILDYSIFDALRAGFDKIVFIIRPDFEDIFKKEIGDKFAPFVHVAYAHQTLNALPAPFEPPADRQKPWGTAHAIMVGEKVINEPFAVINADDFYGRESFQVIADYLKINHDAPIQDYAMVGYILRNALSEHGSVSRGVCESDAQGFLVNIEEYTRIEKHGEKVVHHDPEGNEKPLSGDEIVSMNMWGFKPSFFPFLKEYFVEFLKENMNKPKAEYFITSVVDTLIEKKIARVKVLKSQNKWFGVTYKEDKENVVQSIRSLIDQGIYPENILENLCVSKR
ncbi:nucleotidyltransferase [Candidatus Sumerlaeota bacterium]|nr:nucleotidyltransferase [Candidatus Sumerlaeota bacterium]